MHDIPPDVYETKIPAPAVADPLRAMAAHCRNYTGGDARRGLIQLSVTLVLFAALISAMFAGHFLELWWFTSLLALPAAGLLVRLFIIQHDCGHGSFFPSRRANEAVGRLVSLLTVTPYDSWRRAHNLHHAAAGNLDKRGEGGIDTITVREYRNMTPARRFFYRLYRNPPIMLLLGTPLHVIVLQRIPFLKMAPFFEDYQAVPRAKIWRGIVALDLGMAVFYGALFAALGWQAMLAVWLPVLVMTAWIGGWLFYVQHQFEDAYWQPKETWEYNRAALEGSSYYALPRILHWFSGHIGLHHIHHLCSAIPNYRLRECLEGHPELQAMNRMTIRDSLRCLRWSLWDEDSQRMVGFKGL